MVSRETGIGVGSYCEHLHRGMHLNIAVSWDLRARGHEKRAMQFLYLLTSVFCDPMV